MKFNIKSRSAITLLIALILSGFGVAVGPEVAPVVAEVACQVVECSE